MNKDVWTNSTFIIGEITKWSCPTCGQGVLKSDEKNILFKEAVESKRNHTHDDWSYEFTRFHHAAILTCTNTVCNDIVACVGSGRLEPYYDEHDNEQAVETFEPKYFYPALGIIQIPKSCAPKVREEIERSFSLYWCDLSSCANKIGVAIERIMDDKKVKSIRVVTKTSGKKRRIFMTLHQRINEEFRVKEPEIADQLLAIKWIRNAGSHADNQVAQADVIEAYELLEHALEELYDRRSRNLKKRAKEINKAKGPTKRKIRTSGF